MLNLLNGSIYGLYSWSRHEGDSVCICSGDRARIASSAPGECSTSQSGDLQLERELDHALRDFVRLKTVSCDPTLQEDCFRGAKFLATMLEALGETRVLFFMLTSSSISSVSPRLAHKNIPY